MAVYNGLSGTEHLEYSLLAFSTGDVQCLDPRCGHRGTCDTTRGRCVCDDGFGADDCSTRMREASVEQPLALGAPIVVGARDGPIGVVTPASIQGGGGGQPAAVTPLTD